MDENTDRTDDLGSATEGSDLARAAAPIFHWMNDMSKVVNTIQFGPMQKDIEMMRNDMGNSYSLDSDDAFPRELNLQDPFELAISRIVAMNRTKRQDYALDDNPFSNFEAPSALLGIQGFGPTEAALFNILQKVSRLQSLRTNGRMDNPANESVSDTYLDLAVYAVICYTLHLIAIGEADNYDDSAGSN